ncbi:MAG: DEAD/DEAH box helicase, partial [bacterium]|nr:DEAD/DEAH box helicase [bacterium]
MDSDNIQCIGTSATLAGDGTFNEQQKEIAETSSLLFGSTILPDNVIGETLQQATKIVNIEDQDFIRQLKERVTDNSYIPPSSYNEFVTDPLSCWLESTLGIREEKGSGRLLRVTPRSIKGKKGVVAELSGLTGADEEACETAIRQGLLAGYLCQPNPETGFKPFAFRLHQFISRGGSVYATLEPEHKRHLTVFAQQFVPGDRKRLLYPLVFCRECGQEYYRVILRDSQLQEPLIVPWEYDGEVTGEEGSRPGYLFAGSKNPWPCDPEEILNRMPDAWLETTGRGTLRIKQHRREYLPE